MDRVVDPTSVPGNKLPEKLTKPEVMAEKLARAETSDFNLIATRLQEAPYHSELFEPAVKDYYPTMWLPYQALLATRLEAHFDEVDTAVEAVFFKWQELLEALDREAVLRKRAELLPYANVSESSRERIAKNVARVSAEELSELPQVREMLRPALAPLIKAVHGEETALLKSGLPPILLHFLLELDRQHAKNWQAHSKDQLQWQLLWCHAREGFLLIEGLRNGGKEADPELKEQVRKDLLDLKGYQARLEEGGKKTSDELKSYQALVASKLTPNMVSALERELEQHDRVFEEMRRSALAAFIGLRGCSAIVKLRNPEAEKNSDKARLYLVLARLLAFTLDWHPIVDKLIRCGADEREQIRRAALKDFEQQQETWKAMCKDQVASRRWKSLVDANHPGKKTGKKLSANSSLTRSDRTPNRKTDDADSSKHLGQPDRFLSDAELDDRRRRRAREFLDEHGLKDKAKSVPELADKNLEESLVASSQGRSMLEKFSSFLDETIVNKEGDPSIDLVKLRSELGSSLVTLRTPGTPRGKSPNPSQNNSGTSSGASTPPRSPDSSSAVSSANTPSPLVASHSSPSPVRQDSWRVVDRSPTLSRLPRHKPGPASRRSTSPERQEKLPPQEKRGAPDQ